MSSLGMRPKDLRSFMMVARDNKVTLMIRLTNDASLAFVGKAGYYPKPAVVKAKTADRNPPTTLSSANGVQRRRTYNIAGLVVHPGFHPSAFLGDKSAKALACWDDTMKTLCPSLVGHRVNVAKPETVALWSVDRKGASSSRWSWRVDADPASERYGCLQIKNLDVPWSYVHGDYDLKDVIVDGHVTHNRRNEGRIDGVKNFTPELVGLSFENIREQLNTLTGVPMVQHGAEAQFAWHGDEPVLVAYSNWTHETLGNAEAVQSWYEQQKRKVIADTGKDYLRDPRRTFYGGPDGMQVPEHLKPKSVAK